MNSKLNPSEKQALLFLSLLIGTRPIGVDKRGETIFAPNSDLVLAHLEAVVGPDAIPSSSEAQFIRYRLPVIGEPLVAYLERVTAGLRSIIDAKKERNPVAAPITLAQRQCVLCTEDAIWLVYHQHYGTERAVASCAAHLAHVVDQVRDTYGDITSHHVSAKRISEAP